jgi:hypothetical protein
MRLLRRRRWRLAIEFCVSQNVFACARGLDSDGRLHQSDSLHGGLVTWGSLLLDGANWVAAAGSRWLVSIDDHAVILANADCLLTRGGEKVIVGAKRRLLTRHPEFPLSPLCRGTSRSLSEYIHSAPDL